MEPNCFSFSIPALLASVRRGDTARVLLCSQRLSTSLLNPLSDHARANRLRGLARWHATIRRWNHGKVQTIRETRRHRCTHHPTDGYSRLAAASQVEAATCWLATTRRWVRCNRGSHRSRTAARCNRDSHWSRTAAHCSRDFHLRSKVRCSRDCCLTSAAARSCGCFHTAASCSEHRSSGSAYSKPRSAPALATATRTGDSRPKTDASSKKADALPTASSSLVIRTSDWLANSGSKAVERCRIPANLSSKDPQDCLLANRCSIPA
jgi:hypothetical protein